MKFILFQKQEPIHIIKKSRHQCPNIKTQTSEEVQLIENYENGIVFFDDMLLSKQESKKDLLFTRGRQKFIDLYLISHSYFNLPKNTIRNSSKKFILFEQTLRDILLLFHARAGLDMSLEEWKCFCRKAWENEYDYLHIHRIITKIGEGRFTMRNCNKTTYMEATL